MDENRLFFATLEDKYDRFAQGNYLLTTDFLTLNEQAAALRFLRQHKGVRAFLYGGFADAERKLLVFVPDYLDIADESALIAWFAENPQDCPLRVLALRYQAAAGGRLPGHRDFLGSLLGEGIRREKLGDILVDAAPQSDRPQKNSRSHQAQVVVMAELADYLSQHYSKAGRTALDVQVLPISSISSANSPKEVVKFTISSPRLDNIISAVFHLSRKEAAASISQGKVFVDGAEICKPDFSLKGGEKVVLRGKGKALYHGIDGTSRKGKIYITMEKYT